MPRDTLHRIRESALALFSQRWFETVSVAEICRRAGVSNGVFYRYYRRKDDLFVSLVDEFLDQFAADLRAVDGTSLSERIRDFIVVVTGAAKRYSGQVAMFRESQYRDSHYEDTLRDMYLETVQRLLKRPVTEVEYLYLLSGVRFLATRSLYDDIAIDPELVRDLILNGVFPANGRADAGSGTDDLALSTPPQPSWLVGQSSRDRIIEAGMRLFGQRGVYAVQVSDIVREAGLSVGTFYNHFESKDNFLGTVVQEIGHRTRRYLAEQVSGVSPRWRMEVTGMWCFVSYFSHHREYYEIVREAEFVAPDKVREYYDAFESGYLENLAGHAEAEKQVVANFLMGLSHYTGIEVIFSNRVPDREALFRELARLMRRGIPA